MDEPTRTKLTEEIWECRTFVRALCYRSVWRETDAAGLAEDLTQETFIKIWEKLETFQGKSRFSTWLYRISYNVYIDHIRSNKLIDVTSDGNNLEKITEKDYQLEEYVSKSDYYQNLLKSIYKLPEKLKETIILHYEKDLSFNEISKILNIPKGTVKSRINAGLNELRKTMEGKKR